MFLDRFGTTRYKINLHTHTTASDGMLTPESALSLYACAGYDGIALTDHWYFRESSEKTGDDGITVLSGVEYNVGSHDAAAGVVHIVAIGCEREPAVTKEMQTQEIVDAILKENGLPILAHPAWSLNEPADMAKIKGFFATEIYNTTSDYYNNDRPYSGYFVDCMMLRNIVFPLVASDDTHVYGEDSVGSATMVAAKSDSVKDLLEGLRSGDFYCTTGPEVHIRLEDDGLVHVYSSPVSKISIFSASVWAPNRRIDGKNLTEFVYAPAAADIYVRAEVTDAAGRTGYTNFIKVK